MHPFGILISLRRPSEFSTLRSPEKILGSLRNTVAARLGPMRERPGGGTLLEPRLTDEIHRRSSALQWSRVSRPQVQSSPFASTSGCRAAENLGCTSKYREASCPTTNNKGLPYTIIHVAVKRSKMGFLDSFHLSICRPAAVHGRHSLSRPLLPCVCHLMQYSPVR